MKNAATTSLLLLLLSVLSAPSSPARADDGAAADDQRTAQSVLVIPLLADDEAARDAARTFSKALIEGLEARPHLDVRRLSEVPPIYDGNSTIEARLYLEGCPPNQDLGCQLILGEKVRSDRVVSGRVSTRGERPTVELTFLSVPLAELEYSFEVELAAEEAGALVDAVELTLEELADPFDRNEGIDETRLDEEELDRRRRQKERRAMRALEVALPDTVYQPLETNRAVRRQKIREDDLARHEGVEGLDTPWEEAGLTKSQYVRWNNSRVDLETWKLRAANHFLQPIIGLSLGYLYGPTELDYQGNWIFEPDDPRNVEDSRSTLQPRRGHGFTAAATLGFGLTTFLDFEFTGTLTFSKLNVVLQKYEWDDGGSGQIEAYPIPTESGSQIQIYGLQWKLRFYPVAVWRIKPTIAGGFGILLWPHLGNPNRYDFNGPWYWAPPIRYNDQMLLLDPGVVIELGPHMAITAELNMAFSVRPPEARVFVVDPYPDSTLLDELVTTPEAAAPVYVGFRIGLQVRPFRPRFPAPQQEDLIDDGI